MAKKISAFWIIFRCPYKSTGMLELSHALARSQCEITQFKQVTVGELTVITVDLTGLWSQLAVLEIQLNTLKSVEHYECQFSRYNPSKSQHCHSYEFELIVFNQAEALHEVLQFFHRHAYVYEANSRRFLSRYAQENMQIIHLILGVEVSDSITYLREKFADFCDDHNFDAVLEPVKF